ncbi:hypothetical protein HRR83_000180 [Exophiala dermatitidis]|uniref:Uncharacterized protein n=1 Tax=Exophiala dermatitidis TaxID=5970 RepID=A0AAN6F195_EXODE|nr:hypothetical protein HRR73_002716 [Exophiala dermatitidis]KAJ4527427.1 hypothetical protein HRR74_000181 [Exophiala dermatitidis]KAJ4530992.1 hypothetical protein HRR76_008678 [Exophiala dermatitidis]KAJ4558161.1 hypothetical protein HRR77_000181 [Exophiala dermatitidis]KAJ4581807.1 hypothetical protein HRR79_000814 [Exophiala dermatitidis]
MLSRCQGRRRSLQGPTPTAAQRGKHRYVPGTCATSVQQLEGNQDQKKRLATRRQIRSATAMCHSLVDEVMAEDELDKASTMMVNAALELRIADDTSHLCLLPTRVGDGSCQALRGDPSKVMPYGYYPRLLLFDRSTGT